MGSKRAILLVMDSFGIGAAPDARHFRQGAGTDVGADTLGHIAEAFMNGSATSPARPLHLPHLCSLGLGQAARLARGRDIDGWDTPVPLLGSHACAAPVGTGKDTPSGHWELAGVPVDFNWSYFPEQPDCFPGALLDDIFHRWGTSGSLGNCHASGTTIIESLGAEHLLTGLPIFYTSADSVFQVACHEEAFGLDRLIALCKTVRESLDNSPWRVGRVIARPFSGGPAGPFRRTSNRKDFAVPPPAPTLLDNVSSAGRDVVAIGKTGDIFAHRGTTVEIRASGHHAIMEQTLLALETCGDGGLIVTNFVDFDAVFGHRRDIAGYGLALEEFDAMLPSLFQSLRQGDLLCITADHGNDPSMHGSDHTREFVPVLFYGPDFAKGIDFGVRHTFADVGQSLARWLDIPPVPTGVAMF